MIVMDGGSDDRHALEEMLKGYSVEQLIEEVLVAWDELGGRNEELAELKQKMRVLELDLAERKDAVAPEVSRLAQIEEELKEVEGREGRREGLLEEAKQKLEMQDSVIADLRYQLLEQCHMLYYFQFQFLGL